MENSLGDLLIWVAVAIVVAPVLFCGDAKGVSLIGIRKDERLVNPGNSGLLKFDEIGVGSWGVFGSKDGDDGKGLCNCRSISTEFLWLSSYKGSRRILENEYSFWRGYKGEMKINTCVRARNIYNLQS